MSGQAKNTKVNYPQPNSKKQDKNTSSQALEKQPASPPKPTEGAPNLHTQAASSSQQFPSSQTIAEEFEWFMGKWYVRIGRLNNDPKNNTDIVAGLDDNDLLVWASSSRDDYLPRFEGEWTVKDNLELSELFPEYYEQSEKWSAEKKNEAVRELLRYVRDNLVLPAPSA